ncbi:hypothetical protein C8R47DRAFT_1196471 [Mycena vitilis]|nr:hypothetical protein C8R47DRAFT_1196471 [Mycena vitilis]
MGAARGPLDARAQCGGGGPQRLLARDAAAPPSPSAAAVTETGPAIAAALHMWGVGVGVRSEQQAQAHGEGGATRRTCVCRRGCNMACCAAPSLTPARRQLYGCAARRRPQRAIAISSPAMAQAGDHVQRSKASKRTLTNQCITHWGYRGRLLRRRKREELAYGVKRSRVRRTSRETGYLQISIFPVPSVTTLVPPKAWFLKPAFNGKQNRGHGGAPEGLSLASRRGETQNSPCQGPSRTESKERGIIVTANSLALDLRCIEG